MDDLFTITLVTSVVVSLVVCVGSVATSKAILYFISRY